MTSCKIEGINVSELVQTPVCGRLENTNTIQAKNIFSNKFAANSEKSITFIVENIMNPTSIRPTDSF